MSMPIWFWHLECWQNKKWSQYVNSQPFKIFLILQYYGMCSADQLARHSDYVHGRAFSIYQFTQTLYYLERMSHTDFLICEKSSPLMSILSMFSLLWMNNFLSIQIFLGR